MGIWHQRYISFLPRMFNIGLLGCRGGGSYPAVVLPVALPVVDHPGRLVADAIGIPGKVISEHHGRRRPQLQNRTRIEKQAAGPPPIKQI